MDRLESLLCHEQSKSPQIDIAKNSQLNQLSTAAIEVAVPPRSPFETGTLEQTVQHAVRAQVCTGHYIEHSVPEGDVPALPATIDRLRSDRAQDSLNLPLSRQLELDYSRSNSSCLALKFSEQQGSSDTVFFGKSEQLESSNSKVQADAWKDIPMCNHSRSKKQQAPGHFGGLRADFHGNETFTVLEAEQTELEDKTVADCYHISTFEPIPFAENHCSHLNMGFTTVDYLQVDGHSGDVDSSGKGSNVLYSVQGLNHHDDLVGDSSMFRCPAPSAGSAEEDNRTIDSPVTMDTSICAMYTQTSWSGSGDGSGRLGCTLDFGGQTQRMVQKPSSHLSQAMSTVKSIPTTQDSAAGGAFSVVTADLAWVTSWDTRADPPSIVLGDRQRQV